MKVREVMTRDVVSVRPEQRLGEVAETLASRGISGAPVLDERGNVVGVVSEADILLKERGADASRSNLLRRLFEVDTELDRKLAARTAGEAMTSPPVVIEAGRSVHQAAVRMVDEGVNRLPVLEDGKLVGIVTRGDLVRAFARSDLDIETEIREDVLLQELWFSPERIDARVQHGEVDLRGEVASEAEAKLIEEFVRRVPGVISVRSALSWTKDRVRTR